jgi:hypothetical protein
MRNHKDHEKNKYLQTEIQRITNELTAKLTPEIEKRVRQELIPKVHSEIS